MQRLWKLPPMRWDRPRALWSMQRDGRGRRCEVPRMQRQRQPEVRELQQQHQMLRVQRRREGPRGDLRPLQRHRRNFRRDRRIAAGFPFGKKRPKGVKSMCRGGLCGREFRVIRGRDGLRKRERLTGARSSPLLKRVAPASREQPFSVRISPLKRFWNRFGGRIRDLPSGGCYHGLQACPEKSENWLRICGTRVFRLSLVAAKGRTENSRTRTTRGR
jgi:hypothetical protein